MVEISGYVTRWVCFFFLVFLFLLFKEIILFTIISRKISKVNSLNVCNSNRKKQILCLGGKRAGVGSTYETDTVPIVLNN